ncbi:SPOR domain-containing protein [Halocynthiibacter sp.]|uniref:SPOR domain-containing protein n=1 Tax=Halocynthiibacter sp. TaxID=1979210 RepID=UPI003C3AE829
MILSSLAVLTGCQDGEGFNPFKPRNSPAAETAAEETVTRTVERDVEAPEVFQKNDRGLWDGRPSLGGVWVAHADVSEPGRVIIRNENDGKFVVGALFRRERLSPGPEFQVSSEAAAALGMLAGQPAQLNVVALRREEIVEEIESAPEQAAISAPDDIDETQLDPIAAAAAAIDGATETAPATVAAAATTSTVSKPFIQIGIFSVEANANNTATAMRTAGMSSDVRSLTSNGREFWRVVVGPATTTAQRSDLLNKVKELGFADAYYVSR